MFSRFTLWATLLLALVPLSAQAQSFSPKPKLTTLHRFDGTHGAFPQTTMTLGSDGNFYGVTTEGGIADGDSDSFGTVFKMTPAGKFTTLWRFNGSNGRNPQARLAEGADGSLYGTTGNYNQFAYDPGTAFRITPQGRLTTLHRFGQSEGLIPNGLALAPDGSWYGTTQHGGDNGFGTLFHMTVDGKVSVLMSFAGGDAGQLPIGPVTFGPDGALYGTTLQGGQQGSGTVFRVTPDGSAFSVLHRFTGSGGASPYAGLTLGPDGALYGTTFGGGIASSGTAFRITTAGAFTTLHKFSKDGHGASPLAELTLGPNGNFYGTTIYVSGGGGGGTVFQMLPSGYVTTLYKFHTNFDGFGAYGGVAFGPDGALYGTTNTLGTQYNGHDAFGTIFKMTVPSS